MEGTVFLSAALLDICQFVLKRSGNGESAAKSLNVSCLGVESARVALYCIA